MYKEKETAVYLERANFKPEQIKKAVDAIPDNEVLEAMTLSGIPVELATQILGGEKQRAMGLGPASWGPFYGTPIALLKSAGVLPDEFSMSEIGPSLCIHLASLDSSLQPHHFLGVDSRSHIAAASQVAIEGFKQAGLIPPDSNYQVITGNEQTALPPTDITILSLTAEYGMGAKGVLGILEKQAGILIDGDTIHEPAEITQSELETGFIPMTTQERPGIPVGMGWQLGERISQSLMGDVYAAKLVVTPEAYDPYKVAHLDLPGASLDIKVTVFEEKGKLLAEGWGFIPKPEATVEDIEFIIAIRETIHDLWSGSSWDSNAALAVPTLAADKGYFTVMAATTSPRLAGPMPLAILLRNKADVVSLFKNNPDKLSQIGTGKKFADLDTFYAALMQAIGSGIHTKFELVTPPHVTTITTSREDDFKKILLSVS